MREITESQLRYISGAGGAPATSANAAVLLLVAVANYIFIYFTGTFSVVPVKYILFV